MSAPMQVLALNSGSSSLKFGLYRVDAARAELLLSGNEAAKPASSGHQDWSDTLERIARQLIDSGHAAPQVVGHRVVHGGPGLLRHCLIDDDVLAQLKAARPFAPLHTPAALAVIRYAQQHFGGLPQVACFDTCFHADMPAIASTLPVDRELRARGIRRYGFHGLSCESIVRQFGDGLPRRLIVAHLGNGASVTAVLAGRSTDTSMGLTPSGGVIMGTRSGDLDPGLLVYLMREQGMDAAAIEELIDHRSGLLGISGVGSDMRRLHEAAASSGDARLAIDMFCRSVSKQIAAMIAVLGGVDAIVFTGGIGEHDEPVRRAICQDLSWTGLRPDDPSKASCAMRVMESQEDEQIARHAGSLASQSTGLVAPSRL